MLWEHAPALAAAAGVIPDARGTGKEVSGGAGGTARLAAAVQRAETGDASALAAAKKSLKASIGGTTAKECEARMATRITTGPIFSEQDVGDIEAMGGFEDGKAWLAKVGIGTVAEARAYVSTGKYLDWLKLEPGKRLLRATIAYRSGQGRDDANPPPAYTLGRAMEIGRLKEAGKGEERELESARDNQIREAFVDTLAKPDHQQRGAAKDASAAAGGTGEEALARNGHAQAILTRVLLLLQSGLQVYDPKLATHVDYKEGDVVRALAHGGRVNIRIPALGSGPNARHGAEDLPAWLLGPERPDFKEPSAVKERSFGTHHMSIGDNTNGPGTGSFEEKGGSLAALTNVVTSTKLYGVDLAAGGIGNKNFNGDVILPDGAHGHMFVGFTPPMEKRDGALQIGLETTAPGAKSLVGYEHTWRSTEATANPESSFYGHKNQKVGSGGLKHNERLVDLTRIETKGMDWLAHLQKMEIDFRLAVGGSMNQRGEYQRLAGPRSKFNSG